MAIEDQLSTLSEYFFSTSFDVIIIRLLIAIALIIIGIIIGKLVKMGLEKLFQKVKHEGKVKSSFINLFIIVIQWSIYLVFIDLALMQLQIPSLTTALTKAILVIPAITAAVILISFGFAVAIYLREIVEDSEITGWKTLSLYLYYFLLYVFGVYAVKIALVSLDKSTTNIIIIILTTISALAIFYSIVKNHKPN